MATLMTAKKIAELIKTTIADWHSENENRPVDYEILTADIRRIRSMNEHRDNLEQVVKDLALTNIEIWHQEDIARSNDDSAVVRAKRNIDPLNQHRNDLMEEIDEIVLDSVKR